MQMAFTCLTGSPITAGVRFPSNRMPVLAQTGPTEGRLLRKPNFSSLWAPGAGSRAKNPITSLWWEWPWPLRKCKLVAGKHGACLLPFIAFNRVCNSGDWVFNMWQTSDLFPVPQACLVAFLVTAEWLQSTLSIIQQTYHTVNRWELVLSKLALAVCLKNAKGRDIALPLIRRRDPYRYSSLSLLSI